MSKPKCRGCGTALFVPSLERSPARKEAERQAPVTEKSESVFGGIFPKEEERGIRKCSGKEKGRTRRKRRNIPFRHMPMKRASSSCRMTTGPTNNNRKGRRKDGQRPSATRVRARKADRLNNGRGEGKSTEPHRKHRHTRQKANVCLTLHASKQYGIRRKYGPLPYLTCEILAGQHLNLPAHFPRLPAYRAHLVCPILRDENGT